MTRREWFATYILAAVIVLLIILALTISARAASLDAPYIGGVFNGRITVYHPGVCGYDSGLMQVLNTATGEQGPVYLTWKGCSYSTGIYESDPMQLVIMGSGYYIIEAGMVGIFPISNIPYGFSFQAWRTYAPMVKR